MPNENKNNEEPVEFHQEKDVFGMDKQGVEDAKPESNEPEITPPEKPEPVDFYKDAEFPSIVTRVQALFIDSIIVIVIFFSTAEIIEMSGGAPDWLRGAVLFCSLYLYEPILVSTLGGSLGHLAMGLRVRGVNHHPDKKLFIIFALIRVTFKVLLGWLSFLTVTRNKRRRAIHDILSWSVVIHKPNSTSE